MAYPKEYVVTTDGPILWMDTIQHDGGFWLVPEWTLSPDRKLMRPLRVVSIRMAGTDKAMPDRSVFQVLRDIPAPSSLYLTGEVPPKLGRLYLVVESPDVWLPNPDVVN